MKITKDIIDRIIKEELLKEAEIVDLSRFKEQRGTKAIEDSIESVEDMLAGVAANLLDVIRAVNNSQHADMYKQANPGKLEALELVWDMISDWSYEMYPKTPEDIAHKKAYMTQMPGEDIEATGDDPVPEDVYKSGHEWTPEDYEEYIAKRGGPATQMTPEEHEEYMALYDEDEDDV